MFINFISKMLFGFPEPATPIMEGVVDFHNYVFFFLVLIITFVFFIVFNVVLYFWYFFERPTTKWDLSFRETMFLNNRIVHGTALEIIWTLLPAVVLIAIAFPSFSLLYSMDEVMMPAFTLKVVGHQWYWSYEYSDHNYSDFVKTIFFKNFFLNEEELDFDLTSFILDVAKAEDINNFDLSKMSSEEKINALNKLTLDYFNNEIVHLSNASIFNKFESLANISINSLDSLKYENLTPSVIEAADFDSYMVPESDLTLGDHRMLEVTEPVVLPLKTYLRILVTSTDVLHSFAVPNLGIKADAVPGRLNQLSVFIKRSGVFYGQCSEICGVSHGMMPIVVRAVQLDEYIRWLISLGPKGLSK